MSTKQEQQTITLWVGYYRKHTRTVTNTTVKRILERDGVTHGTCTIDTIAHAVIRTGENTWKTW